MANIKVAGDAIVLTSELKLEDIKLVRKYQPKALTIYGEKDGKEYPEFSIGAYNGEGCITKDGITFGRASRDGGFAQITMKMPDEEGDPKEIVAELIGAAVMKLGYFEDMLPGVIDDITSEHDAMLEMIEIC